MRPGYGQTFILARSRAAFAAQNAKERRSLQDFRPSDSRGGGSLQILTRFDANPEAPTPVQACEEEF